MKHRRPAIFIIAAISLSILLSGCGTIKAMFNGAYDVYQEGQNAWDKENNGSLALLRMAEALKIDSEYEAPKEFLIKNYNSALTSLEKQLNTLKTDNYQNLKEKADILKDLIAFYNYIENGKVANPVVLGDKVLLITVVDHNAALKETSVLLITQGMAEGKTLIKTRKFDDAAAIFRTLLNQFLDGEDKITRSTEIASAFTAKAAELAGSNKMEDVDLGFRALNLADNYDESLPELKTVEAKLNRKKADILLSDAKVLIRKKDAASLAEAYKIYQKVIKLFPSDETYVKEAEALKTDIADSLYNEAAKLERNFDGTRDAYDKIIATYDTADTWVADYNGLRAKRDAFKKNAVIEIFIAVRHSGNDNTIQRALAKNLAAAFPKDRMFEVVSLNSNEGRELANQVEMGSIPMGLAESYGFEYIIILDNFRNSQPVSSYRNNVEENSYGFISQNGSIRKMSESDNNAWSFSATLAGDNGKNLTQSNVSKNLASAMADKGVDELWFNVKVSETFTEKWLEGRLDYSLSFYDTTSRRNWSNDLTSSIKTKSNSGRTRLSSDINSRRLRNYLNALYPLKTIADPEMSKWDEAVDKTKSDVAEDSQLLSAIVSNLK